ncbi:hypothetical protein Ngar_c03420 [Candidatus Nitrososphaera gargensis Ga9.2]|uniref:Uncharacterized protein n=1 Tax=Nitrososphaera gargensis (strain Ga9.2) TaxID=1237085 RepID=K0ICH7_NITGG|nr:hypothetical protein [Candidatus Nitrososphaera gargensis]AFU57260.1 hypothetical protein Ngar_c03120 [Candidatus Nitrososphaera gargensis Ga9.2]AFU57290.1 hypothetical protein Ngar_c03420 [Candidatus Nitrososphaera gargensis Ga9.2]
MAKGWTVLTVRDQVKSRLEEIYEKDTKRPKNQKFTAYLDNLLTQYIDYHEKLQQYGPFIEYKDKRDNYVELYDHRKRQYVNVYINDQEKQLFCEFDNSADCCHVGFCFAIKEVYEILIDHGFRPPKIRASKGSATD